MTYDSLLEKYKSAGQEHVFSFYDSLSAEDQSSLLAQLATIDPARVTDIAQTVLSSSSESSDPADITPLPEESTASLLTASSLQISEWEAAGHELIAANKVAVVLLAGGQGTRLGSSEPKGCFDIGLPSHKSLFGLQAERILSLQNLLSKKTGNKVIIPWYIMTSGPTRKPTQTFFQINNFFGLDSSNVSFFEQGVLPCIDNSGKILLETKSKVAVAPDGNGGIYRALMNEQVLDDFRKRGVEHVHAYCVDNCLVRMADPIFLGFAASKSLLIGTKSVPKRGPKESVGLIVAKSGHPAVIEYSEISEEMAFRTVNSSEDLAFRTANIVNHYYSVSYLESIPSWPEHYLPYHIAKKKIPCVNLETGETINPSSPNGIKLEQFIFDCFPHLEFSKFANLEVKREDEFSPLKNKVGTAGEDDADSSRADLLAQGKRWLIAAGATFSDGIVGVEIPPLVSYVRRILCFL
ncbi:nucleotide-diphospho-sugar transferase [Kockiozyma suomiensis]|uniref:nucleotide-diphospho-sugar transferase n=1 Tax=Kockiozyma suomiensis TaxID=1337062 RepID=UPI003343C617